MQKTIGILYHMPCRDSIPTCPPHSWLNTTLGCQPCHCSSLGSAGSECDQQTGQCRCREQFSGQQCRECEDGAQGCRGTRDTHVNSVTVDGSLGQFCLAHGDCTPRGAECRGGTCHCQLGYKQQSPIACAPSPPLLCSFSPCEAGGTCEEHDGTFTCHCGKGRTGKYCQQEVEDTAYTEAGLHCVKPNQEFCHKNFPSEHSTLKD